MIYYIKEPLHYESFFPIALNRPVYDIVLGCMTLKERLQAALGQDVVGLSHRFETPSDTITGFVFASDVVWNIETVKSLLDVDTVVKSQDGKILIFYVKDFSRETIYNQEQIKKYIDEKPNLKEIILEPENDYYFGVLNHISDIFLYHKTVLESDLLHYVHESVSTRFGFSGDPLEYYHVSGDPIRVFVKQSAQIAAQVVMDVSQGSIVIEEGAKIGSFTYLQGPCFIGKNAVLDQAIIRQGSVILDSCKVGGEIEESIMMPFSNKHHEGFLGHSYIGKFVNLGALTTTSDLKNNYKPVKCVFENREYQTHQLKIGSFIGDYSALGIGSLLTTGTCIGLGSSLVGGSKLLEYKDIPCFTWKNPNSKEHYRLKEFLETVKTIIERRNQTLSLNEEKFLKTLHKEKVKSI